MRRLGLPSLLILLAVLPSQVASAIEADGEGAVATGAALSRIEPSFIFTMILLGVLAIKLCLYASLAFQRRQARGEVWALGFSTALFFRLIAQSNAIGTHSLFSGIPGELINAFANSMSGFLGLTLVGFTVQSLGFPWTERGLAYAQRLAWIQLAVSLATASFMPWFPTVLAALSTLAAALTLTWLLGQALIQKRATVWIQLSGFSVYAAILIHDIWNHNWGTSQSLEVYAFFFLSLCITQAVAKLVDIPTAAENAAQLEIEAENQRLIDQQQKEEAMLGELAIINHETFYIFMSSLSRALNDAERLVDGAFDRDMQKVEDLFILVHTAEEASHAIGLSRLHRQLHELSLICTALLHPRGVSGTPVHFQTEIEGIRRLLRNYLRLNAEHLGRNIESIADVLVEQKFLSAHQPVLKRLEIQTDEFEKAHAYAKKLFAEKAELPLSPLLNEIMDSMRPYAKVQIEGEKLSCKVSLQLQTVLRDLLEELSRNALTHGIESAEERALQGKAEEGTLLLSTWKDDHSVYIRFRDDGRGLNAAAVPELKSSALVAGGTAHIFGEALLPTRPQSQGASSPLYDLHHRLSAFQAQLSLELDPQDLQNMRAYLSFSMLIEIPLSSLID